LSGLFSEQGPGIEKKGISGSQDGAGGGILSNSGLSSRFSRQGKKGKAAAGNLQGETGWRPRFKVIIGVRDQAVNRVKRTVS